MKSNARVVFLLLGVICLLVVCGLGATIMPARAVPSASTAATSNAAEPSNQDNSHNLVYSTYGYYYLFYVNNYNIYYVSSPNAVIWSSPAWLLSSDGVNEGQAVGTYYDTATNTVYWVVGAGGVTSFQVAWAQPNSTGGLSGFNSATYSDGLGYSVNQPSISMDSNGNLLVAYEGLVIGTNVNVVVDRIAAGSGVLTNIFNWNSGQTSSDWDGKIYPYGTNGAFTLFYSSLHTGGASSIYIQDYNGTSWGPQITTTLFTEVTHGNGFTVGNTLYYVGQADGGYYGVFYTHTLGSTTPPTYTTVFPTSLGIDDGYGTLSWDGQSTIVAYYSSGVSAPYTIWASVSTNLGVTWTPPVAIATSATEFAPEDLGTNLFINNGISDVYWAVETPSGTSLQVYRYPLAALASPTISAGPATIDSGQSGTLSTATPLSGGVPPYTCQWLDESPGESYGNLSSSFGCGEGGAPATTTGSLSATGVWSFELQVTDSEGTVVTSAPVTVDVDPVLAPPTVSVASGSLIDLGQPASLTSSAMTTGVPPYSYQWFEEPPGSSSFATIAGATTPSYAFLTTGSTATGAWSFELQVTDSSGLPVTVSSATAAVTVDQALSAGPITPSAPVIDNGQPITLTADPAGGSGPFSYMWYSGTSAACSSDTTLLSSTTSAQPVNPAVNTYYCYSVTDSANPPETVTTASPSLVTVNPSLTAGSITPSSLAIDAGQSVALTAQASGGTLPYQYSWWSTPDCSTTAASGSTNSDSYVTSGAGTYYYLVTDSSYAPASSCSGGDTVTVNPSLSVPGIDATSPIATDQNTTITVSWSGGTLPYTVILYNSTSASCSGTLTELASQTGLTQTSTTFLESPSRAGTYDYCASVVDSSHTPVTQSTGTAASVTVGAFAPPLTAPVVSANPGSLDAGQSATLSTIASFSGGTPPYTCQWLEEAPGASSYADLGAPSDCTAGTSMSEPTGVLSTIGTWSFELQVTDSSDPANSVTSQAASLIVDAPFSGTSVSISPSTTIDSGQSVTLTVAWTGAGTPPYSVQLETSSSSSCASPTPTGSPKTDQTGTSTTFSVSPIASTYYCATVTDSAPTAESASATSAAAITTNGALSIAASSLTVDSGQTAGLTAVASGGSGSYTTYSWYGGSTCSGTALQTSSSSSYATGTLTSNTEYCMQVTDSLGGTASATVTVTVDPFPTISAPLTPVVGVDQGQTYTYSVAATGGVGPYDYAWSLPSGVTASSGCTASSSSCVVTSTSPATYPIGVTVSDTGSQGAGGVWPYSASSLTVNQAVAGAAIMPSSGTIDSGQAITVQVSWNGGAQPYSVTLYSSSSSSCGVDNTVVGTQTGQQASPYTFSGESGLAPTTSTYYCAKVADSGNPSESSLSPAVEVTVKAALSVSVSPITIDSGQTGELTAVASGGSGSYSTYDWYQGSSCSGSILGAQASYTTNALTENTEYCVSVTDSLSDTASTTVTVTVNSALVAGSASPSGPFLDNGQSVTLKANPSGGTTPYSYKWYSGTSATCSSDTTVLSGTASTESVSPTANTYYCYAVTDGSATPSTQSSSTDLASVEPAFTGTSVSISPSATIDSGQSVTLTVTWTSAGTSPYSVQLTKSSSASCASPVASGTPNTGVTGTSSTFSVSPTTTTYYCATVTDSATSAESSSTTSAATITVNTALASPVISTTTTAIDSGQSASFTVTWAASGTAPYTVTLYYSSSSSSCTTLGSQISQSAGLTGTSASFTVSSLTTGTDHVCATLKDSSATPKTTTSATPATVTVNAALAAGAITPASPVIDSGQSVTLTANPSGGTTPYSYKWYSGTSATCSSDTTVLSGTASTESVSPTANTYYCYAVTDSAKSPESATSATNMVSVVAGPALDGSVSAGCDYVTSCTVSLTTTHSDDVIIVGCNCYPLGTSFTVTDTAGLVWTARAPQLSIGGDEFIQTWYAIAASPLTADKISVTTADTGETWYGVVAFGVSGANTANPFVSGMPIAQANGKCSDHPCNTGVSAPAGSFVFQIGGDTGSKLQTAGSGMTLIRASTTDEDIYAQYEVPSTALASATLSFGTSESNDFGVIVDAINPASNAAAPLGGGHVTTLATTSAVHTGATHPFLQNTMLMNSVKYRRFVIL